MAPSKQPKKTKHGYIYNDGGSLSYAITKGIQDPKNVTISGKKGQLYTAQPFDPQAEIDALMKRLGDKYPSLKPYMTGIILPANYDKSPDFDFLSPEGKAEISSFDRDLFQLQNSFDLRQLINPQNAGFKSMLYTSMANNFDLGPQEQEELARIPDFGKAARELCEEMLCITNRMWGYFHSKIPMGTDTSRNYEVIEDVAYLLGCAEMVVPSKRISVNNGKPEYATFVEEVPGHKIFDEKQNNIFIYDEKTGHNPLTDPDALRLLSKMSVMDYITGSSRYDWNDLTFQTDPQNPSKIVNIVRNRPGECFGGTLPDELPSVDSSFPRLEDIPVIPRSTANKVMALDKKKLFISLSGKGLTKSQLTACWNRVEKLQQVLKNPVNTISDHGILVVDDHRFGDLNLQELYVKKSTLESGKALLSDRTTAGYRKNIFNRALDIRSVAKLAAANRDSVVMKPYTAFDEPVNATPLKETQIHTFCKQFSSVDPAWLKSSHEFAEMKAAMLKVDKFVTQLQTKQNNNEGPSLNELKKLSEGFREIQKRSSVYLKTKDLTAVSGKYGKARYEFAKLVHDFATQTKMLLNDQISQKQGPALQNDPGVKNNEDIILQDGQRKAELFRMY